MICIYHDDLDGQAAAACVHMWAGIRDVSLPVRFVAMDYRKDVPFELISEGEQVWIVDFSLQKPGAWEKLFSITKDVTWIDHHKTAIEQAKGIADHLPGLRIDGTAACELTFRYIHHYSDRVDPIHEPAELKRARAEIIPVPKGLKLIGDRDVWNWKYGEETAYFCAGLGLIDTDPESENWHEIIAPIKDYTIRKAIESGKAVVKFKESFYRTLREAISFQTEIDGHEAIALNVAHVGSEGFGFENGWKGELPDEWPILMPFYWDGDKWTVSLYSKSVDVSEIAKRRGGGGHTGASGFQSIDMPEELRG